MATALGQGPGEILLHGGAGDSESLRNLIDGATVPALQYKGGPGVQREIGQGAIEGFQATLEMDLARGIRLYFQPLVQSFVVEVQGFRDGRLVQGVLVNDVAGHRQQVGLRVSDLVVPIDPKKAQEYFLGEVRRIGGIAQSRRQEGTQALSIADSQVGYETLSVIGKQGGRACGSQGLSGE